MGKDEGATARRWSAARIGFFPAFALLGAALPISFLIWIEKYLYYLPPFGLIPTYGTAWLLLAALALPFSALCSLGFHTLDLLPGLRKVRRVLAITIIGLTAATVMAAFAYAALLWARTFQLLIDFPVNSGIVTFSIAAVVLIALTGHGRGALNDLYSVAKYGAAVGALTLISLPFSGWDNDMSAAATAQGASVVSHGSRPHILLVTIDTLSAAHMSLYGAIRQTTPNLEAFARGATTFDRAYANANFTTTGISSILTATQPWTHRALQLPSWPIAATRSNSVPALLGHAGYHTGYFATNIFASPAKNGMAAYFDAGSGDHILQFSFCSDRLSALLPYNCAASQLPPFTFAERVWARTRSIMDKSSNWHFDPRATSQPALAWLAAADKRTPIFLWVHFMPPHAPYAAPSPWLGQFDSSPAARDLADSDPKIGFLFSNVAPEEAHVLEARYDESIEYVDHYVGEFLREAAHLLGNNTVVIITADHGESFEHGYGSHGGPGLFESIVHIPLIVKFPLQTQGQRTAMLAEQVDIGPTLADLAGIRPPASWEGHSLAGLPSSRQGAPAPVDRPVFTMNFEENQQRAALTTGSIAVIDGQWKLVHHVGTLRYPRMPQLHDELFDLAADPGELTNRIADQPDETERLRKLVATELAVHGAALP